MHFSTNFFRQEETLLAIYDSPKFKKTALVAVFSFVTTPLDSIITKIRFGWKRVRNAKFYPAADADSKPRFSPKLVNTEENAEDAKPESSSWNREKLQDDTL